MGEHELSILADLSMHSENGFDGQSSSLESWLIGLKQPELQVMMELNGWDNLTHIGGLMAKEDLVAMGINNDKIKLKLLRAVEEDLPRFNHVTVPETVEEWLNEIDLSRYLPRFNTNRMGSVSRVLEIWEIELTSILHIEPIGHRKRIMKSIRELRLIQSTIDQAQKKDGSLKKKGAVQPKWFHTKEDMLRGVDYAVRYFGCAKLNGPESPKLTAQLCAKQQKKISDNQKVPEFRLRISAGGIEFIDRETQQCSTKYPIEDISFVSRDKADLLVFSFISTDRKIGIKMCHVFKAASRNQSFETCSTIAQSFEVAYEIREEKKKTGS